MDGQALTAVTIAKALMVGTAFGLLVASIIQMNNFKEIDIDRSGLENK